MYLCYLHQSIKQNKITNIQNHLRLNGKLPFLHKIDGFLITNHHDFGDGLTTYLYDNLFCHFQNLNTTKICCCSSYKVMV